MGEQKTLGTGFEKYSKTTRREKFLTEMDHIVPWGELCALIAPVYPKAGDGRPPKELEMMLRCTFGAALPPLLEAHALGEKLFQQVHVYLERQGVTIGTGTIVDATIISAASSTKNKDKRRDP